MKLVTTQGHKNTQPLVADIGLNSGFLYIGPTSSFSSLCFPPLGLVGSYKGKANNLESKLTEKKYHE